MQNKEGKIRRSFLFIRFVVLQSNLDNTMALALLRLRTLDNSECNKSCAHIFNSLLITLANKLFFFQLGTDF